VLTFPIASTALIVVDAQRGFSELCPAELPVPGSLAIVPKIDFLMGLGFAQIHATQDWHPENHRSFLGQRDNIYPPHCVAGTPGGEFLPGLDTAAFHAIWRKGYDADVEAYAVTAQHPGFIPALQAAKIEGVAICGISTNICCFYLAKDLAAAGLTVIIAEDACAGIDIPAAGLFQATAKAEGQKLGIFYWSVADITKFLA